MSETELERFLFSNRNPSKEHEDFAGSLSELIHLQELKIHDALPSHLSSRDLPLISLHDLTVLGIYGNMISCAALLALLDAPRLQNVQVACRDTAQSLDQSNPQFITIIRFLTSYLANSHQLCQALTLDITDDTFRLEATTRHMAHSRRIEPISSPWFSFTWYQAYGSEDETGPVSSSAKLSAFEPILHALDLSESLTSLRVKDISTAALEDPVNYPVWRRFYEQCSRVYGMAVVGLAPVFFLSLLGGVSVGTFDERSSDFPRPDVTLFPALTDLLVEQGDPKASRMSEMYLMKGAQVPYPIPPEEYLQTVRERISALKLPLDYLYIEISSGREGLHRYERYLDGVAKTLRIVGLKRPAEVDGETDVTQGE